MARIGISSRNFVSLNYLVQVLEASYEICQEELLCFLQKMLESGSSMKPTNVRLELFKVTIKIVCCVIISSRCSDKDNEAQGLSFLTITNLSFFNQKLNFIDMKIIS